MSEVRSNEERRVARKLAAVGVFPLVMAVVGASAGWAEDGLGGFGAAQAKGSDLSEKTEEPAVEVEAKAEVPERGVVALAASAAPLLGPAPLTAEEQRYIDNGELTGQAVGAGGGAAAAGAPAAAIGAVAGGAIGTAVAGPFGTIPGAIIGGVAAGAIVGSIGASYGYEAGGEAGAEIAEDQVRADKGETSSDSGSFGDIVAGIPLLAP